MSKAGDNVNIDEMQAGRELDALVAEKVMKWRWDNDWDCLIPPEQKAKPSEMWTDWQPGLTEDWREPVKENHVPGVRYNGDSSKIILPHYSTNIAAAWEVVEKLQVTHYVNVNIHTPFFDGELHWCYFELHKHTDTHPLWSASGNTTPLAICRAALKAVENW